MCMIQDPPSGQCGLFFFFQAEDGIRDLTVTGVQTCALPISSDLSSSRALVVAFVMVPPQGAATGARLELKSEATGSMDAVTRGTLEGAQLLQIGRASCRERV